MARNSDKSCSSLSESSYDGPANFPPRLPSKADYEYRDPHPDSSDSNSDEGYFSDDGYRTPPDPGIEMIKFASTPSSVAHAREVAVTELLLPCRTVLTILELTRMRKSRIGLEYWTGFWYRIYQTPLSDMICSCVREMYPRMDKIFRISAEDIMKIIANTDERIARAQSEGEIKALLCQMELQIRRCVNLRQVNAQIIFERMRLNLEAIPVDVKDVMFDDLKRGIFALDADGNYHPGDPVAEEKDKHVGKPLSGGRYVTEQPDLVNRPGFTGEFQTALANAAALADEEEHESTGSTGTVESEDSSCESLLSDYSYESVFVSGSISS